MLAPARVTAVPIVDRPRDAEFAWLRQHAQEYRGQWVALDGAQLLGAADHLQDLLKQLSSAQQDRALFHRVDID